MKTKCMSCGGSMKKMAVGGTTTKRIIKKSTGGMYGIPQENLGTSGQYGFAQRGGGFPITAKAATRKVAKGKGMMTYNYGTTDVPGSDDNKGAYMKFDKNQDNSNPGFKSFKGRPRRVMQKGGTTKATKFAALAPPYDKATFADRIAGAKKSAGSKKLPKAQLGAIIKGIRGFKNAYKASKIVKQAAKKGNFKDWHNEMDILLKKSNPNIKKYIDKETVIKNFKKVIKSKPGDTYKSAVNLKSISPKPKNTYKSAVNLKNTSKVKVNAKNKK